MNILTSFFNAESVLKNMKCNLNNFIQIGGEKIGARSLHNKNPKFYSKYYKVLELPDDADQDLVRRAFINMCKKYHPDSGSSSADAVRFQEIDEAYKELQNKFAEERWNVNEGIGEYGLYYDETKMKPGDEVKVFDIKHNAPQHRQYLSLDGIGSGTSSQRQKQYENYQRMNAIQNIYNHRIKKLSSETSSQEQSLIIKDKAESKKIKTRYGMERLVEDLIQESMAKGEFDNLKGAGKPLPQSDYNPYVDFVTHKMNQVMIDNGFVPEWITLQKEIGDDIKLIKKLLSKERKTVGPLPLSDEDTDHWQSVLNKLTEDVNSLNKKIDKFNLVVPILNKQILHFNLAKESGKILEEQEEGECSGNFKTNSNL